MEKVKQYLKDSARAAGYTLFAHRKLVVALVAAFAVGAYLI